MASLPNDGRKMNVQFCSMTNGPEHVTAGFGSMNDRLSFSKEHGLQTSVKSFTKELMKGHTKAIQI